MRQYNIEKDSHSVYIYILEEIFFQGFYKQNFLSADNLLSDKKHGPSGLWENVILAKINTNHRWHY